MSLGKDDPVVQELSGRVRYLSEVQMQLALTLEQQQRTLDKVAADSEEVVKAFKSAKGAFEALEWAGKVSKILLPIFLAVAALTLAASNLAANSVTVAKRLLS